MNRARSCTAIFGIGLLALLVWALPASAGGSPIVYWKVVGIVSGEANSPATTAHLPRPLANGDLVEMTFAINSGATSFVTGSYASYPTAITAVRVKGSDWAIQMRAPLSSGNIVITNDDPDYGDMLSLVANSPQVIGRTWYGVEVDLNNPGGPSPGVGPWQPFSSLALPKSPPAIGFFPSQNFYLMARRDQPGQAFDGIVYWGQILSMVAVKAQDD